jgi:hypothetical protein
MNQVIQLDGILSEVQNDQIQVYSTTTVVQLSDQLDYAINPTIIVAESQLNFIVYPNALTSTETFGVLQLDQFVTLQSIESTVLFGNTEPQLNIVVIDEIESGLLFGQSKVNFIFFPESIQSNVQFEIDHSFNAKIFINSVESTVEFGEFTQLNMEIDNVPFPSIESTVIISTPNVLKVIGPLSIASTESIGVSSFVDNIHRLLVFKDDNISKIGENDAAVISGGIRLNPASTASNTATSGSSSLPEAPVGFLSVNIGGVDYKIPYYNS